MNVLVTSITLDLLLIASALGFGIAVFILVRVLFPKRFIETMQENAAERRLPQTRDDGYRAQPSASFFQALGGGFIHALGNYLIAFVSPRFEQKMRRRYLTLGAPERRSQDFIAQQIIYMIFFGLIGLMLMNLIKRPLFLSSAFFLFGFFFPHIILRDLIKKRQREIRKMMPYHIDLLTLSVEAGLDFGGALQTVVERGQPGPLIEEFSILLREMKFGKTREEALRNIAHRVDISEMSTFVSNLVQADKMGTSMGKVLRIQSGQMRVNRAQAAEKAANEAPVKMILPLVLCFFPTVFMILFGPIIFRLFYGGL